MKNDERYSTYGQPTNPPSAYDESSIRHLKRSLDHVRMRPGMYIGGTNLPALHNMVFLVLEQITRDNDRGTCTEIIITLDNNQIIFIQDNAPGLAIHQVPSINLSHLEILMTQIGAGGPYPRFAIVNALSDWMIVQTNQQGAIWQQTYFDGVPQTPVERGKPIVQCKGTTFIFRPDFTIFQPNEFQFRTLARRCFELAYLIPNLRVTLRDKREGSDREVSYFAADGAKTFIEDRFRQRNPLHPLIHARQNVVISTRRNSYEIGVEFALLFTRRQRSLVMSYANTTFTQYGGTHQEGLLDGVLEVINENSPTNPLTRPQIERGLIAILSIQHPVPQFESQRKISLMNPDAYDAVFQFVRDTLCRRKADWLPAVLEKLMKEDKSYD